MVKLFFSAVNVQEKTSSYCSHVTNYLISACYVTATLENDPRNMVKDPDKDLSKILVKII